MRAHGLHTVCEEAGCPNIGECWAKRHATFMIMGDTCTRACAFCNVRTGLPRSARSEESPTTSPRPCASWASRTSSSPRSTATTWRDGGAAHFAQVIAAIRAATPATTIEVLTPDFLRKDGALETVVAAGPDVFNHNLETVPRLYLAIRPGARYFHSLRLLQRAKELAPSLFTKSGIMVGLGEAREEVMQVMDDLRSAGVDFLTIGQYLQPSPRHAPVVRFVPPDEFDALAPHRARQGVRHGCREPAHAVVLSRRRGLRAPQGRARAGDPPRSAKRRRRLAQLRDDAARTLQRQSRCSRSWRTWSATPSSCRCARAYPCARARSRGGDSILTATMTVGYRAIAESFTSRVTLRPEQNEIVVAYLDGPFTHLDNRWRFRDAAGGSEIDFFIDYAFASRMLAMVMGAVFDKAVQEVHAGLRGARAHPLRCACRLRAPRADRRASGSIFSTLRALASPSTVSSPRTPVRIAPSRSASLRSAPVRSAPVRSARDRSAFLSMAPARLAPRRLAKASSV